MSFVPGAHELKRTVDALELEIKMGCEPLWGLRPNPGPGQGQQVVLAHCSEQVLSPTCI